ncbi:hypothetical protein [Shewanella sp. FJAT-52076]|uniref:hypothetical protein n=1 Tax=Shewanella sp. FJAT-52076 TaxID=2864202 RepID=UPI001C65C684|nr:hypothetical protein [Shewanella sp. FJAT-52076]QYJ74635.1 hypothetical protein K0H79_14940 [Shewanella sp. FJAT-52076]
MRLLLSTVLALVLVSGCTSKPVLDLDDLLVPVSRSGATMPLEKVEQSILTATRKRGWVSRVVEPGLIEAQISVRSHGANVLIPFNQHSYSIHYKDSANLDFDEGSIHRNYNKWVHNLSKSIRVELQSNSQRL